MKNFIFMGLIGLTLIMTSNASLAQDADGSQLFVPPGSLYENNAARVIQEQRKASFGKTDKIAVKNVQVSLVHHHYMEPEQFGIMMKTANQVSGCFDISPLEYEASFIEGNYMDIKVKDFRRNVVKTKDVAFDCDQKSKVVSGLVVVSANDLKEKGVRQIRFNNGSTTDNYDVTIKQDSIVLKPESMIAFKAIGLSGPDKDRLVHYFNGKTIVALHIPMARDSDDITQAVRNLAYKRALTPVFEQEGLDTSGADNIYYFMDPTGRALDTLADETYTELGTIQAMRPYDGPQGRQGLPVPLKVFMTRPGTTL